MDTRKTFYIKAAAITLLLAAAGCALVPHGRGTLCLTFDDLNCPRGEAALPLFAK